MEKKPIGLGSVDVLSKNLIYTFQLDNLKHDFFNVIPARMTVIYKPRMALHHLDATIHYRYGDNPLIYAF